jgi:hypothetical protein
MKRVGVHQHACAKCMHTGACLVITLIVSTNASAVIEARPTWRQWQLALLCCQGCGIFRWQLWKWC